MPKLRPTFFGDLARSASLDRSPQTDQPGKLACRCRHLSSGETSHELREDCQGWGLDRVTFHSNDRSIRESRLFAARRQKRGLRRATLAALRTTGKGIRIARCSTDANDL